ncbi:hypothetical protein HDV00_006224 [Rhizophlyctis rosea]|nr:hypothetical protein HDV00_006224 [Rhizophlyctis rosea]
MSSAVSSESTSSSLEDHEDSAPDSSDRSDPPTETSVGTSTVCGLANFSAEQEASHNTDNIALLCVYFAKNHSQFRDKKAIGKWLNSDQHEFLRKLKNDVKFKMGIYRIMGGNHWGWKTHINPWFGRVLRHAKSFAKSGYLKDLITENIGHWFKDTLKYAFIARNATKTTETIIKETYGEWNEYIPNPNWSKPKGKGTNHLPKNQTTSVQQDQTGTTPSMDNPIALSDENRAPSSSSTPADSNRQSVSTVKSQSCREKELLDENARQKARIMELEFLLRNLEAARDAAGAGPSASLPIVEQIFHAPQSKLMRIPPLLPSTNLPPPPNLLKTLLVPVYAAQPGLPLADSEGEAAIVEGGSTSGEEEEDNPDDGDYQDAGKTGGKERDYVAVAGEMKAGSRRKPVRRRENLFQQEDIRIEEGKKGEAEYFALKNWRVIDDVVKKEMQEWRDGDCRPFVLKTRNGKERPNEGRRPSMEELEEMNALFGRVANLYYVTGINRRDLLGKKPIKQLRKDKTRPRKLEAQLKTVRGPAIIVIWDSQTRDCRSLAFLIPTDPNNENFGLSREAREHFFVELDKIMKGRRPKSDTTRIDSDDENEDNVSEKLGLHKNYKAGQQYPRPTDLTLELIRKKRFNKVAKAFHDCNAEAVDWFFCVLPDIMRIYADSFDKTPLKRGQELCTMLGCAPFYRMNLNRGVTVKEHWDCNDGAWTLTYVGGNFKQDDENAATVCLGEIKARCIQPPGGILICPFRFLLHWVTAWEPVELAEEHPDYKLGPYRWSVVLSQIQTWTDKCESQVEDEVLEEVIASGEYAEFL